MCYVLCRLYTYSLKRFSWQKAVDGRSSVKKEGIRREQRVLFSHFPRLPSQCRNDDGYVHSSSTTSIPLPHSSLGPKVWTDFLVLRSLLLTSLQLIQIPPTNRQIPPIIIHALPETANFHTALLGRLESGVGLVLA